MNTIGEFSRISKLSIKTLRFYHEQGILIPEKISSENYYRLYGQDSIEKATRIKQLKNVGFSIHEIKTIFKNCKEEEDMGLFLPKKRQEIKNKIQSYQEKDSRLEAWEQILNNEKVKENFKIKDTIRKEIMIATVSLIGEYSEIGKGFILLFKKVGSLIHGKCFALFHDMEYKGKDSRFEACYQVRKAINKDGIQCRIMKTSHIISLLHKGPYGTQGNSYAKIFDYCQKKDLKPIPPIREVYLNGPGMLFKGNPDKYLTEIQISVVPK